MRKMLKQTCPDCGRTLQLIEYGRGQIKCPRCGRVITYHIVKKGNEQSERRTSS
jgi:uncharacterized Zn finger protein (UPF0148 family)